MTSFATEQQGNRPRVDIFRGEPGYPLLPEEACLRSRRGGERKRLRTFERATASLIARGRPRWLSNCARQLRQLDEAVLGGCRIDEGDAAAGVADARHRVDQVSLSPSGGAGTSNALAIPDTNTKCFSERFAHAFLMASVSPRLA